MINHKILNTGSKGNAVIIENKILIDCGVSFKDLEDYYKSLKLVLLTHIHKDHFSPTTIRKLAQERPTLRFGCHSWLAVPLVECGVSKRNIDIYNEDLGISYNENLAIETFLLEHNVPNCGYKIFLNDKKIIYATDTNSMSCVTARNYDLYLIEANYTEEEIVQRIRDKQENSEYCYEYQVLKNHLSREKADDWLYQNMGVNSQYVYMHSHIDIKKTN